MRDVLGRALAAWDAGVPGYGFVLGCYAFALEDTGDYGAAGARRAGGGRAQTRQTFEPPTPSRMSWR